jgi:hypothetical protein
MEISVIFKIGRSKKRKKIKIEIKKDFSCKELKILISQKTKTKKSNIHIVKVINLLQEEECKV